ncbi:hypothetical protein ACH42_08045 [Endozoicomonas sp. (ex Bugula neritina AB1)]|nr:hypothetical protein ACH42_08045 [Endozoicomonas sp. (ex Bugula neritina AB1)]
MAVCGLITATLCWGGNAIAGRLSVGDVPPVALSFWRWVFALLILWLFSGNSVWRQRRIIWRYKGQLSLLAFFSITAFNTVLYLSAQSTQAVNIALIQTSLPIMAMLLSIPVLHALPLRNQMLGGLIAIPGLLIIFSQGSFENLSNLVFGKGDLLMVLATFCWATYTVLLKRFSLPIKGSTLLTTLVLLGVVMLFPFYLWELSIKGGFSITASNIGLFIYLVLFPSLLSYLAWNYGVSVLGASQAAMFIFLIPVFAAVLAIPILNESLESRHILASVFIFCGLWLTTKPQKKKLADT